MDIGPLIAAGSVALDLLVGGETACRVDPTDPWRLTPVVLSASQTEANHHRRHEHHVPGSRLVPSTSSDARSFCLLPDLDHVTDAVSTRIISQVLMPAAHEWRSA